MENNLNILLVSDDEVIHNQILNALGTGYQIERIDYSDVIREVNRDVRDLIIFVQPDTDISVEVIQSVKSISPHTFIIYIAKKSDFTLLRNITSAGAAEFFVYPDEHGMFIGRFPSIAKNYELTKKQQADGITSFTRGRGQIISFFSGNGGTGKSTLAATFAQTLKLESTAEVILIDLNFQFGGIETLISIESNRSIADLTPVISELNESHIRNVSQTEQHSKMQVLISPCDAEVAETLTEEFTAKLLRTCRRSFDFVIVDLPSYLNSHVVTALEESDKIYYVLAPDTPSLKTLKQVEELSIRLGIDLSTRVEIIFNKIAKDNEIQRKDIKNILRFPITASIRRDLKGLQSYVNKGEPIRKATKEKKLIPFAKDVRKWALAVLK